MTKILGQINPHLVKSLVSCPSLATAIDGETIVKNKSVIGNGHWGINNCKKVPSATNEVKQNGEMQVLVGKFFSAFKIINPRLKLLKVRYSNPIKDVANRPQFPVKKRLFPSGSFRDGGLGIKYR